MMLPLWLALFVLLAFATTFILWPLRRKATGSRLEQVKRQYLETNVALFNEHLAELQASRDAGRLSESAYQQLKLEQERALLQEERELASSKPTKGRALPGGRILIACGVVLLLGSISLYQWRGSSADVELATLQNDKIRLDREDRLNDRRPDPARTWALAEKLQERLKAEPDSTQHLFMMAMYARELGSYDRAIDAYERILSLEPESPRIMSDLAETLFIRDDNRVTRRGRALVEQALALDPEEPTALGLAGIDAFSQRDYRQAISFWQRALDNMDARSGNAMAFQRGIERARSALGEEAGAEDSSGSVASINSDEGEGSAEAEVRIPIRVSLSDSIDFDEEQTVFIYARAWQGSPMPLAIKRVKAGQLPMSIVLDDTMAMSPAATLGQVKQVELLARLSKDGDAVSKPGDWQTSIGPVSLDEISAPFELIIDEAVQ